MLRKNEAIWIESTNRWCIKVQKDGVRKPFYSSTKGKKGKVEAEKKADRWLDDGSNKIDVRFGQAWNEYLEEVRILTGSGNYRQTEQIGRLWLLPSLKHRFVRSISDQDWQACINNAYKKGKYKKTLMNIRGRISNFCKFAQKARYIDRQPFDLQIPKDANVRDKIILQPDSVKIVFTEDIELWRNKPRPAFYIHAFRFIVATGLRRGELCGLMKNDIQNGLLSINRAINDDNEITTGKNDNALRTMKLGMLAKNILDDQKAMLKEAGVISPYIFPEKDGHFLKPLNFYRAWKRFCETHDLITIMPDGTEKTCDIQGLRRTIVSLLKNKMPEDMIKRIVGHSESMDTLTVYGFEVDGELEQAAGIIDDVFYEILSVSSERI